MSYPFPEKWGESTGRSIELTQDGRPEVQAFGVQVDWDTVDALTEDTTFPDGIEAKAGDKVLLIGTPLGRIESGPKAGLYGVYDPAAEDGRESLFRGRSVLVNQYVHQNEYKWSLPGGGIIGGKVWRARMRIGTAAKGVAALDTINAAFPRLVLVDL